MQNNQKNDRIAVKIGFTAKHFSWRCLSLRLSVDECCVMGVTRRNADAWPPPQKWLFYGRGRRVSGARGEMSACDKDIKMAGTLPAKILSVTRRSAGCNNRGKSPLYCAAGSRVSDEKPMCGASLSPVCAGMDACPFPPRCCPHFADRPRWPSPHFPLRDAGVDARLLTYECGVRSACLLFALVLFSSGTAVWNVVGAIIWLVSGVWHCASEGRPGEPGSLPPLVKQAHIDEYC